MSLKEKRIMRAWRQDVPSSTARIAIIGIAYFGGEKRGVTQRKIREWTKGGHGQIEHAFETLIGAGLIESAGMDSQGEEKYRIVSQRERKGEQ